MEDKNTTEVRSLLTDDDFLRKRLVNAVSECINYGKQISCALTTFETARNTLTSSNAAKISRSELYSKALRGDIHPQSVMIRDLLLIIKKSNSATSLQLLDKLLDPDCIADSEIRGKLQPIRDSIKVLVDESDKKKLTSEYDIAENALRTTAISRRVQMSEHKAGLTGKDSEYSKLIAKVHNVLLDYFTEVFVPMKHLLLHEIFFYENISPHKEVFMPRQRTAVEDALAKPSEYLACECCEIEESSGENIMRGSNPASSIAYQLYLQGGALINAFDLWRAFQSVLDDSQADEDEDDTDDDKFDVKTAQ